MSSTFNMDEILKLKEECQKILTNNFPVPSTHSHKTSSNCVIPIQPNVQNSQIHNQTLKFQSNQPIQRIDSSPNLQFYSYNKFIIKSPSLVNSQPSNKIRVNLDNKISENTKRMNPFNYNRIVQSEQNSRNTNYSPQTNVNIFGNFNEFHRNIEMDETGNFSCEKQKRTESAKQIIYNKITPLNDTPFKSRRERKIQPILESSKEKRESLSSAPLTTSIEERRKKELIILKAKNILEGNMNQIPITSPSFKKKQPQKRTNFLKKIENEKREGKTYFPSIANNPNTKVFPQRKRIFKQEETKIKPLQFRLSQKVLDDEEENECPEDENNVTFGQIRRK